MLYYNVIISWALFYFVSSFRANLLWKDCGYGWNDEKCFVPSGNGALHVVNKTTYNCTTSQFENPAMYSCEPINITGRATPTEQFY